MFACFIVKSFCNTSNYDFYGNSGAPYLGNGKKIFYESANSQRMVENRKNIYISDCEFFELTGVNQGGAIYLTYCHLALDRSFFAKCVVSNNGGAVYESEGNSSIRFCCFNECNCYSTESLSGRVMYSNNGQCQKAFCSFYLCSNSHTNGGDSTFSQYMGVSESKNLNISHCYGRLGILIGEVYKCSSSSFQYCHVVSGIDYTAAGTWYNPCYFQYINFIDLPLSNCVAFGYNGMATISDSIIWNCTKTLYASNAKSITLINCLSDYSYEQVSIITKCTTFQMNLENCLRQTLFKKYDGFMKNILFFVGIFLVN